MYRPSPSATAARHFLNVMKQAGTNALSFAHDAVMGALIKSGIYEQAMRENRRRTRTARRYSWHARNHTVGLNGKQAIARRLRQIAAGSLRVENGLVA